MPEEGREFAEVSDLLAPATGEKEVEVKSLGKMVRIKKVNVGELAGIMKVARDSEIDQYIWLVFKGLVRPKMEPDQVRCLKHTVLLELASEIQKFSELDKDSMSKLENLLKKES